MKHILLFTAASCMSALSLNAADFSYQFGAPTNDDNIDWGNSGMTFTDNGAAGVVYSYTDANNITFDLTLVGYDFTSDADIAGTGTAVQVNPFTNGAGVGIEGAGTSGETNQNQRIDASQYMTMSLAVSGAGVGNLDTLSFNNLNIRYEGSVDGQDNRNLFNAGGSVVYNLASDPRGNYSAATIAGAGLDVLTKANVGTWDLSYAVLRTSTDGVTALGSFAIDYTVVPEPGTYALVAGLIGLTFVAMRRRK